MGGDDAQNRTPPHNKGACLVFSGGLPGGVFDRHMLK